MNLQDLVYFHHLAESLSFTETAKHFFVSQPSISTAVKRLESELDAVLIDRRKKLKKIKLTAAGELFYQTADEILKKLDTVKQEIEDIELEAVYFGFLPTIGGYFMPSILPNVEYPTNSIKFVEEESSDIMLNLVLNEQVPIAIIGHKNPEVEHKQIKQFPLLEEEIVLWVRKGHPLATKSSVSVEEIQDEVIISLSEEYTHYHIFAEWVAAHKINEENIAYAKEIKTIESITASTNMVAFMSNILFSGRSDLVKIKLKDAPKFYISLVLNTEIENTYNQQRFNDEVMKALAEI